MQYQNKNANIANFFGVGRFLVMNYQTSYLLRTLDSQ